MTQSHRRLASRLHVQRTRLKLVQGVHKLHSVASILLFLSNDVRWVPEILQPHEVLLYAPGRHKTIEDANAPCFIVRPACTCAAKRLLSNGSTRTLLVVIHITSRVAQLVRGSEECLSVSGEAASKLKI
jgi:hypothetical protein